MGTCQEVENQI